MLASTYRAVGEGGTPYGGRMDERRRVDDEAVTLRAPSSAVPVPTVGAA